MPASSKPPASALLNRNNTNWETLSFEIGNELGKKNQTKHKKQTTTHHLLFPKVNAEIQGTPSA